MSTKSEEHHEHNIQTRNHSMTGPCFGSTKLWDDCISTLSHKFWFVAFLLKSPPGISSRFAPFALMGVHEFYICFYIFIAISGHCRAGGAHLVHDDGFAYVCVRGRCMEEEAKCHPQTKGQLHCMFGSKGFASFG